MEYVYRVYKTTNKINGKYYIGVHKAVNNAVDDGYMGCGHYRGRKLRDQLDTKLYRAFRKYGDDAFVTEILYTYQNKTDAFCKEQELVNIYDINCYNNKPGGAGGFHPNTNKGRKFSIEERQKMSDSAKARSKRILTQTDILKEYNKQRIGKTYIEQYGEEKAKDISLKKSLALTGRKLSDDHKQKMSANRKGKDCGKCTGRVYVWDEIANKLLRITKSDLDSYILSGIVIEQPYSVNKFRKVKFTKIG